MQKALKFVVRDGVFTIPNFMPVEECQTLQSEIETLIVKFDKKVWRDPLASDSRIFGAEKASAPIHKFFANHFVTSFDSYEKSDDKKGCIMAARLQWCCGQTN